jgi:hypothetical protein
MPALKHRARHRKRPLSCGRRLLPNRYATRQARPCTSVLHSPIRQPRCSLPLESLRRVLFGHPFDECPEQVSLEMTKPLVVELARPWGSLWLRMAGMPRFGGTGNLILQAGRFAPTFVLRRMRYGRAPADTPKRSFMIRGTRRS